MVTNNSEIASKWSAHINVRDTDGEQRRDARKDFLGDHEASLI